MSNCDICNDPVESEARKFSASQVQAAAKAGLRPRKVMDMLRAQASAVGMKQEDVQAAWLAQVMADTSGWRLCPSCAVEVDRALRSKPGVGDSSKGEAAPQELAPDFNECSHCAICTSLKESQVSAEWVLKNLLIMLATLMGIKDRKEIEARFAKMKDAGFRFHVLTGVSQADILSGAVDSAARGLPSMAGVVSKGSRCEARVMRDPIGQTDLIRFCFFWNDRRASQDAASIQSSVSDKDSVQGESRKRWWQFWK